MKITVFTPTYNRGYIIENLYRSLQRQTFKDFEWLVVDDGSTDNTEDIFNEWCKGETPFPIRYYKQENGGKCRAINRALDLAKGKLFVTIDSDDYLTDDALFKIDVWEKSIPHNEKYCGVTGSLGTISEVDQKTNKVSNFFDGTLFNRYDQVKGELAIAFYTEIHKKYKYPTFDNEKFMTEAVTWNRMAHDGYQMRFYDDIICIYEYREDGITKAGNKVFIDNPKGYGLWLKEKTLFESRSLIKKLKLYYTFSCELSGKYNAREIAEYIGTKAFIIKICLLLHRIKSGR